MVEGEIRLTTEIGDVHRHPAARLEHPVRLDEHPMEEPEVLVEGQVLVVVLADVVRR